MNSGKPIYSNISDSHKKKQNVLENKIIKMIGWKYMFLILVSITIITSIILGKVSNYLKTTNNYTPYGLKMVSLFNNGIVINMFIMVFTVTFYFNIKQTKGHQGMRGTIGKKGIQGEDSYCDICTKKPIAMKRPHKLEEHTFIDSPPMTELEDSESGWKKTELKISNRLEIDALNKNIINSKTTKISSNVNKYFVGIIANTTGSIKQIQFIFRDEDNNTIRFPETKIPESNSQNELDNKIQISEAPINYGVYKIDYYIDKNLIVGLKLYFKNYITKHTLDEEKVIGLKNGSGNPLQLDLMSYNGKQYVGFLSDIDCEYNNNGLCKIIFYNMMFNLSFPITK
jgi:hypothetical protein